MVVAPTTQGQCQEAFPTEALLCRIAAGGVHPCARPFVVTTTLTRDMQARAKIHPSPYLLLTLTVLFWAGNFVLGRGVHDAVPPIALSFWRWATALLIVAPFVARPLWTQRRAVMRAWKTLLLLGVLGVAGFSTLVYVGLQTTTATNGVLLNTTNPVLIILISWLFLRQRLRAWQVIGVALGLLGVLVIVTRGELQALRTLRFTPGDLFVLAGVACWAVYTVCLRWRPAGLDALTFLGATVAVGVAAIAPFYVWELGHAAPLVLTPTIGMSILYFALFPSVLAYIFWNRAVTEVGASTAGLFIYLMPVFGVLLSLIFLRESLYPFHLVGIALVVAGVYFATTRKA